jgi:protocatechuate 3,4-dioxygenase alpha subunit
MTLAPTGSQTVGPFFGPAMLREGMRRQQMAGADAVGQRIRIEGRVLDGDGASVADALIELWQANAHGRYDHPADSRDIPLDPAFDGFGRTATEDDGTYWFETVKPGVVPMPDGAPQAPHIVVTLFARGLLNHVVTRLYFADEAANTHDPILALVPAHRRDTLLARPSQVDGHTVYHFDVVLQGEHETAFFAV